MRLLCIDPGTLTSGVVIYDPTEHRVLHSMPEVKNEWLITFTEEAGDHCDAMLVEMVASYGMPVGAEVFETVLWTGRFMQAFGAERSRKVYRKDVKLQLCHDTTAKDRNIRQALHDRFNPTGGGKTPVVGTKSRPGPLYGVTKHAVSALAVGVAWWEKRTAEERLHLAAAHEINNASQQR